MYKILIADDEALMRKGLCTLIDWAKLGCQIVGTAENGLQAKQAVLDYQPDIIIADIKMPVMDGLELARWVCGAQRQIQIILLTAFADFSYAQQAIQYGVSDYVTKTGNMNDIVAAVERCKQKLRSCVSEQSGNTIFSSCRPCGQRYSCSGGSRL